MEEVITATKEDVYQQGYEDYFDRRAGNPYNEDTETELHLAWEAGWIDAQWDEEKDLLNEDEA
jgi:hypothetical protein